MGWNGMEWNDCGPKKEGKKLYGRGGAGQKNRNPLLLVVVSKPSFPFDWSMKGLSWFRAFECRWLRFHSFLFSITLYEQGDTISLFSLVKLMSALTNNLTVGWWMTFFTRRSTVNGRPYRLLFSIRGHLHISSLFNICDFIVMGVCQWHYL